jgi:hypothetical protein
MHHAIENVMTTWPLDEGVVLYVGPARNLAMLEVGVRDPDSADPLIIHAMPARARYLP